MSEFPHVDATRSRASSTLFSARWWPSPTALAFWLVMVVSAGLLAALLWDPRLATRLVAEGGVLEVTQVSFFLTAGLLSADQVLRARGEGRATAPDLMLVAGFALLVIGETDLDRWVVGTKMAYPRLIASPEVWLPHRLFAVLLVVVAPLALGIYAFLRRRELWAFASQVPRERWGQLYLVGGVIFVVAELSEGQLNVATPARNFFEEYFEFLGAVFGLCGTLERRALLSQRPPGGSTS